jgi:hypothetical protein
MSWDAVELQREARAGTLAAAVAAAAVVVAAVAVWKAARSRR